MCDSRRQRGSCGVVVEVGGLHMPFGMSQRMSKWAWLRYVFDRRVLSCGRRGQVMLVKENVIVHRRQCLCVPGGSVICSCMIVRRESSE